MLTPKDFLPSALGLQWNMSMEECLKRLDTAPLKQSLRFVVISLYIHPHFYNVTLRFGNQGGLWRIETLLHASHSFTEIDDTETIDRIITEFEKLYIGLLDQYVTALGDPVFSGVLGDPDYPEDQGSWKLAFWNTPEGRMQVELDHPDKEYPIHIKIACYTLEIG